MSVIAPMPSPSDGSSVEQEMVTAPAAIPGEVKLAGKREELVSHPTVGGERGAGSRSPSSTLHTTLASNELATPSICSGPGETVAPMVGRGDVDVVEHSQCWGLFDRFLDADAEQSRRTGGAGELNRQPILLDSLEGVDQLLDGEFGLAFAHAVGRLGECVCLKLYDDRLVRGADRGDGLSRPQGPVVGVVRGTAVDDVCGLVEGIGGIMSLVNSRNKRRPSGASPAK